MDGARCNARISYFAPAAPFSARPGSVRLVAFQADGRRQTMDNPQSERQSGAVLLLRRYRTELPPLRPVVHMGVSAAGMRIVGRRVAIANQRRLAANGGALR